MEGIYDRRTWNNMSNTERQLRHTIEDQDKEICLLKDQLNRLTDINNKLWNLFIEQSKQIRMLNGKE